MCQCFFYDISTRPSEFIDSKAKVVLTSPSLGPYHLLICKLWLQQVNVLITFFYSFDKMPPSRQFRQFIKKDFIYYRGLSHSFREVEFMIIMVGSRGVSRQSWC